MVVLVVVLGTILEIRSEQILAAKFRQGGTQADLTSDRLLSNLA